MTEAAETPMFPAMNTPTALSVTARGARRIQAFAFLWAAPAAL